MAGRAGRRGKDDLGASILCIDDAFGRVPHSEDYTGMFDNKGKDLESKLKLSYKTNLNVLNQQGQDITSLVANSFFSNETEKKKLTALQQKIKLQPRVAAILEFHCDFGEPEAIENFDTIYKSIRQHNDKLLKNKAKLPTYSVVRILTSEHQGALAVIIDMKKDINKIGEAKKSGSDNYIGVVLTERDRRRPVIRYDEQESDFELL